MSDQIVLLEGRKEVTTFLLDDGDVTSKDVVTETGQNIGYEYTSKLYPEDTVTISDKSEIGKEMVKKYTGDNDEIPIGIIVNDPMVMDNGQRKASVLVLGQLYRLKLAGNINDIVPADKIKLTALNYQVLEVLVEVVKKATLEIPDQQDQKETLEIRDLKAIQVIQVQKVILERKEKAFGFIMILHIEI